jgi:hypothetical protein
MRQFSRRRKALVPGDVFERLTVLGPAPVKIKPNGAKTYRVYVRCSCGNERIVYEEKLRVGHTKSCGCLQVEASLKNLPGPTHGYARKGPGMRLPIYSVWRSMLDRCENKNSEHYPAYGARGIKVCERWHNFVDFLADVGPKPPRMSLDRIDNNGHYEPSNCRWASYYQQAANRRNTVKVFFRGEQIHLSEVGRRLGIDHGNIRRYATRCKTDIQTAVDHYAKKYPNQFNANNISNGTNLPTVLLRVECAATDPPRPLAIGVFVDGRPIASMTLAELRNTFRRLEELEKAYFATKPIEDHMLRLPFRDRGNP